MNMDDIAGMNKKLSGSLRYKARLDILVRAKDKQQKGFQLRALCMCVAVNLLNLWFAFSDHPILAMLTGVLGLVVVGKYVYHNFIEPTAEKSRDQIENALQKELSKARGRNGMSASGTAVQLP